VRVYGMEPSLTLTEFIRIGGDGLETLGESLMPKIEGTVLDRQRPVGRCQTGISGFSSVIFKLLRQAHIIVIFVDQSHHPIVRSLSSQARTDHQADTSRQFLLNNPCGH
jgi:hypothetical protein